MSGQYVDDATDRELLEYPEFAYKYSYDERRQPSEVTIVTDDTEKTMTEWVTAPIGICLPVEECR